MQIEDVLKTLGLNEKEARIYLSLLKLGRDTAYGVALEAGLKRPNTYVVLDDLVRKGFVTKITGYNKLLFAAKSPEEVFADAKERLRLVESKLPELAAIADKPDKKFKILYYEGFDGLGEMFKTSNQRMKGKEILGFYARVIPEQTGKELEEKLFQDLNETRKKLGITMRGITSDDPSLAWYKERIEYFGQKLAWLNPKEYLSDASIEMGDDFIQIASHRYLQGILIENPDIARAMRQIFEIVWNCRAEKEPQK